MLLALCWAAAAAPAAAGTAAAAAPPAAKVVQMQNPMQFFNSSGAPMNVHDGDVRQWTPGGPFYYYGMCTPLPPSSPAGPEQLDAPICPSHH